MLIRSNQLRPVTWMLALLPVVSAVFAQEYPRRQQAPQRSLPPNSVGYFYTNEYMYRKLEVRGSKIRYTYNRGNTRFGDETGSRIITRQEPHWTDRDLVTEEKPLTQPEVKDMFQQVRASGFLKLAKQYPPHYNQRAYPQTIVVTLDGVTHPVVLLTGKLPKAFALVEQHLFRLCKAKLHRDLP